MNTQIINTWKKQHPYIAKDLDRMIDCSICYHEYEYKGHEFHIEFNFNPETDKTGFNYGFDGKVFYWVYTIEEALNLKVADDGTTYLQLLYENRKRINEGKESY